MLPGPTLSDMRLHCRKCDHIWTGKYLTDVPINAAVAYMKTMCCPECGAGMKKLNWVLDEGKLRDKLAGTS